MIKANELRIGSLLKVDINYWPVDSIITVGDKFEIYLNGIDYDYAPYVESIPLTEEWLEKLGFEKQETDLYYLYSIHDGLYSVRFIGDRSYYFEIWDRRVHMIMFVHQLQNLYFALTGQELTINLQG